MLDKIRFILINTTHPGNIGAAARAMKTMGLSSLWLVNPNRFPGAVATARASGATDVLANAHVVDSLDEALEGVSWVLGTSARLRSLPWPVWEPQEAAASLLAECQSHPVAVLFGRERYGLTNDELKRCHFLVNIPANPEFSSLNLAASVQLLGYEIYRQSRETVASVDLEYEPAPDENMEGYYRHLEETLHQIKFLKGPSEKMLLRLRRLYNRARPSITELNILRGILSDTQYRAGSVVSEAAPDKHEALDDGKSSQQQRHPDRRTQNTED